MIAEAPARPVTPTERKIAEMLLENTGSHFLDSGGAYGRAWQMTRAKYGLDGGLPNSTFHGGPGHPVKEPVEDEIDRVARIMREEPAGHIDDMGSVYVDTFHWLVDRLEYDPELDAKYQRFTRVTNYGKDRYDRDWGLPVASRFMELLDKRGGFSDGIYPGERPGFHDDWINTYNHEDQLDRTLQFALYHVDEDGFLPEGSYVLLQIHGGADVRGGYTDPVLFRLYGEQGDMLDFGRMEVYCEGATETRVPDDQAAGQITMDGEALTPVSIDHAHRWDNHYDNGSTLRLTYSDGEWLEGGWPGKREQVLVFPWRDDEEQPDEVILDHGYTDRDGKVIRPDVYATANWARKDEDTGEWLCPFDGSKLRVMGAIAS